MLGRVRRLVPTVLTAVTLVACSAAGGPTSPGASTPPATSPDGGGSGQPSANQPGGGSGGIVFPVFPPPIGGQPNASPKLVVPRPGRLDVHPVGAILIESSVDGRHVFVRLTWWSGVEPCSVLDSVGVERTGADILLTLREGADQRGVACIQIALLKATIVDLGELEPGTYTISAFGDAPPIQVTVG